MSYDTYIHLTDVHVQTENYSLPIFLSQFVIIIILLKN